MKSLSILIVILALIITNINAQTQQDEDLYREIRKMDSILADAYNTGNMDRLKNIFDEGLEFYHDTGGLGGYKQTLDGLQNIFNRRQGHKRELIKESLEVYPVKDYGAIETGSHRFCHVENNKDDCGTFKFVHIWQKKNGTWKLTRAISYDHN